MKSIHPAVLSHFVRRTKVVVHVVVTVVVESMSIYNDWYADVIGRLVCSQCMIDLGLWQISLQLIYNEGPDGWGDYCSHVHFQLNIFLNVHCLLNDKLNHLIALCWGYYHAREMKKDNWCKFISKLIWLLTLTPLNVVPFPSSHLNFISHFAFNCEAISHFPLNI